MKRGTLLLVSLLLLPPGGILGCEDEGDPLIPDGGDELETVSFSANVQPIFDVTCVGCHGQNGNGGLDLRIGLAHANLVGVVSPTYDAVRVVPGDPGASVLFDKVSGGGQYGSRMPLGGPPLPTDQIETIRRWIAAGATDDTAP